MQRGVLIGADHTAAALIPWWWSRYTLYNTLPVTLIDWGISEKQQAWCHKRMQIQKGERFEKKESGGRFPDPAVSTGHVQQWQRRYPGPLWRARTAWFKKPRACLQSPFTQTLWLDLDCEVCGPLEQVFEELEAGMELGIVREDPRLSGQEMFNSGVLLFPQHAPFLSLWEEHSLQEKTVQMGDQDILTELLLKGKIRFKELPATYNWLMFGGVHPAILIAHWAGGWGKEHLQRYGGLHELKKGLLF